MKGQSSSSQKNMWMKSILISGGAGFIGSHLVRHFVRKYSKNYHVVNADSLTYAGNLASLADVSEEANYEFRNLDIRERNQVFALFREFNFVGVINLAAETHVDKSIDNAGQFVETNILGTLNLLDAANEDWSGTSEERCFCQISTDEVFGSLGESGKFTESTPYAPRSPYAASKAGADHLVRAYHNTYSLPVKLTNCTNNYGSHQFPEKLIPLCITRIADMMPIPVYGEGQAIRDWLYVEDHVKAIDRVFHAGEVGETYLIGGGAERRNIDVVTSLCRLMDAALERELGDSERLISFVEDRPGHDFRYAIDYSKISDDLGWEPLVDFDEGLARTVKWYLENPEWVDSVKSGAYLDYQHKARTVA